MYLLRRIFKCKPGEARREGPAGGQPRPETGRSLRTSGAAQLLQASLVQKQAEAFEQAGQRSSCRVYFNGATTPSEPDTVVLEWTDEALRSTMRSGLQLPQAVRQIGGQVSELTEGNRIEIMELMTPDKMLDV